MYDKLVAKVNNINTSGFVLKGIYDAEKSDLEKEISDTSGLIKKTDYNAKITEIEGKIPSQKKTDYNTKLNETEKKNTDHSRDKYITIPDFNKLTAENFAATLTQASLVTKTDLDDTLKNFNKKVNPNKTKHVLVENGFKKLETFDSIYFRGKSRFEDDVTQNYLVFQTIQIYFKRASNTNNYVLSWKPKGLSDEIIKPPSTSNNALNPLLNYVGTKIRVEFKGSCLEKDEI